MAFITAVVLALRPSAPTAEVLVDAAEEPLELLVDDESLELEEEPEYPEYDEPLPLDDRPEYPE